MKSNVQVFIETRSLGRSELTERANSYSFGTLQPGGWWQAQVVILAPERDLWILADADEAGTITFVVNGEEVWSGDLSGTTLERNRLTIRAQGAAMRLKGDEVWRVFADSEYNRWAPVDHEKFTIDNNNRLFIESSAEAYTEGDAGAITYPDQYVEVGGDLIVLDAFIEFWVWGRTWTAKILADETAVWNETRSGSPDDIAKIRIVGITGHNHLDAEYIEIENSLDAAIDTEGILKLEDAGGEIFDLGSFVFPASTTIKVWSKAGTNTATERYMGRTTPAWADAENGLARLRNSDGNIDSEYLWRTVKGLDLNTASRVRALIRSDATIDKGAARLRLTHVCVRTMAATTNTAIIAAVLAENDLSGSLQDSGLTIDQMVSEGKTGIDLVRDLAYLGDGSQSWVCVLYENGMEFRPWSTTPDWLVTRADLATWSIQRDRENVHNIVRARLPDGWKSAWISNAASVARYGRREKTLSVPQTSQAEARRWAQIYLSEMANVLSSLRIEATRLVRKPDDSLWPAVMIRAGHVVALRDLIPQQDVIVRVSETTFNGSTLQIVPVGASSRLEVILARREAVAR
jgi:hypothetical protein